MKKTTASIQITLETKNRINLSNYADLAGTKKENILCALIVNLCASTDPITAEIFLTFYNWLVATLYQGIIIDFETHPLFKDSVLFKEAYSLKGDETDNLINRKSLLKIANLISNNDKIFEKELDSCYTNFEEKLLLFSFCPGCLI